VRQREDLETIVEDLVDDTVRFVEDLANRRLVPFWDDATLFRKVAEQFHPLHEPVEPVKRGVRTVECDVVHCSLSPPSCGRGPDDSQRLSLALSSATTSSWGMPSPRANSSLACRMSRITSISSTKASY